MHNLSLTVLVQGTPQRPKMSLIYWTYVFIESKLDYDIRMHIHLRRQICHTTTGYNERQTLYPFGELLLDCLTKLDVKGTMLSKRFDSSMSVDVLNKSVNFKLSTIRF